LTWLERMPSPGPGTVRNVKPIGNQLRKPEK
jgi:hypothetical protein